MSSSTTCSVAWFDVSGEAPTLGDYITVTAVGTAGTCSPLVVDENGTDALYVITYIGSTSSHSMYGVHITCPFEALAPWESGAESVGVVTECKDGKVTAIMADTTASLVSTIKDLAVAEIQAALYEEDTNADE